MIIRLGQAMKTRKDGEENLRFSYIKGHIMSNLHNGSGTPAPLSFNTDSFSVYGCTLPCLTLPKTDDRNV